jgi:hypothetical protein
MVLAGGFLLYYVAKLTRTASVVLASKLVHASVIYLPVVLLAVVVAFKSCILLSRSVPALNQVAIPHREARIS